MRLQAQFDYPKMLSTPRTATSSWKSEPLLEASTIGEIQARKQTKHRYHMRMTTEAILRKSVRYDRVGKPVEVVIPYEEFVDFVETYGLDLTDDEKDSIAEAKADREAGRTGNFVALEDLEKELGICCEP